jgi:hypothetical protein
MVYGKWGNSEDKRSLLTKNSTAKTTSRIAPIEIMSHPKVISASVVGPKWITALLITTPLRPNHKPGIPATIKTIPTRSNPIPNGALVIVAI